MRMRIKGWGWYACRNVLSKESFDLGIIVVKGIIHLTFYASLSCINLLVRLKTHEKHRSHERKKTFLTL